MIENDSLKKESSGTYAKLINDYNRERDLVNQLKNDTSQLSGNLKKALDNIKDGDEKILQLNSIIATFKPDTTEVIMTVYEKDSTKFNFMDVYPPTDGNYFIKYYGVVDPINLKITGRWEFKDIALNVIMTETDYGVWNSRLVGPDWLIVNNMEINSLPPKEFTQQKKKWLRPYVGLGLFNQLNAQRLSASILGGVDLFDKFLVGAYLNTDSSVGVSVSMKLSK